MAARDIFVFGMTALSCIRLIPHLIADLACRDRILRTADLDRWSRYYVKRPEIPAPLRLVFLLTWFPEFRSLFYRRVGWVAVMLRPLCRPMTHLYLGGGPIGPGLFIQHGFSTIALARSIGANCWINQQVTIGYADSDSRPTIGNNVQILAGAKVIGEVTVGDNSIIGANCVVVKDVPANVTVVGVPARIVRRDGRRTDERL
jgi:serine O-acetyltransferase